MGYQVGHLYELPDMYVRSLEDEWDAKVTELGGAPNYEWITEEFGKRPSVKGVVEYTCDVGYLFTKEYHTVQSMHVDYLRRKWQKDNWVGFIPL